MGCFVRGTFYVLSVGHFVRETFCPWDVFSVGRFVRGTFYVFSVGHFVRGTFCPWDVLSVGRFVLGRFVCASILSFKVLMVKIKYGKMR